MLVERQVVGVLVAAGRRDPDDEWPSVPEARQRFAEHLTALPEPPRQLTPVEQEQRELHEALGVRRGRR